MAPKPRPIRKPSGSAPTPTPLTPVPKGSPVKPGEPVAKDKAMSLMPPPPDPSPAQGILEREVKALQEILMSAVKKTGELYAFHADTRRLGVGRYAPHPPRSLMQSLGQEVEKYDQLCDAIEAHLQRSIAVLQRDLQREEQKLKEKEDAIPPDIRMKTPVVSPIMSRTSLPPVDGHGSPTTQTTQDGTSGMVSSPMAMNMSPPANPASSAQTSPPPSAGSSFLARRQSVVTQSSLHRPSTALLPKLDLSSSSLRINPDELMRGLGSPVTLAPRSAKPSAVGDLPPDLLSALSNPTHIPAPSVNIGQDTIDLTLDPPAANANTMAALGNSADKPIELDFDVKMMPDLFGRGNEPSVTSGGADPSIPLPSVFDNSAMQSTENKGGPSASDLLQSLTGNAPRAEADIMTVFGEGQPQALDMGQMASSAPGGHLSVPPDAAAQGGTPSPASLLSSLTQQQAASASMPWDLNGFDFTQGLTDFAAPANAGDLNMEDMFGVSSSST